MGDKIRGVVKAIAGKKKLFMVLAAMFVLGGGGFYAWRTVRGGAGKEESTVRTGQVTRETIVSSLSASGTISPKDTYAITSMAEGEVIECSFEAGDRVTKGEVLYRIDSTSMESQLRSANNSLERSRSNYADAVKDYQEALSRFGGSTYKSTRTGYIKDIKIAAGDKISNNTQIAEIYNDTEMEFRVPFLNVEAMQIIPGMPAILTLSDTLEQLDGVVIAVAALDETLEGGRLVRYVTIRVANPGGLTTDMAATAMVGVFTSGGDGTFTPVVDSMMAADLPAAVEATDILVHAGDYVTVGSPIFAMKSDDAEDLVKSYKNSMDQAQENQESAQSKLDSTQDSYDRYTITAPISGTVVSKNTKVGDKIQNSNSPTQMAVIYDLSSVTFEMNIDELDISNVRVGQKVEVEADAFSGQSFEGEVTMVSMEGTASNGVTYFPVTVTMTEFGGLLPGMNVEGTIILDSSENALAIPADALQRGNRVYVKDTEETSEKHGRPQDAETAEKPGREENTQDTEKSGKPGDAGNTEESGKTARRQEGGDQEKAKQNTGQESTDEERKSNVPEGFHSVRVETGLISDDYVEILSGDLREGDEVYITQTTTQTQTQNQNGQQRGGMGGMGGMGGTGGGNQGGGRSGGGMGGPPM